MEKDSRQRLLAEAQPGEILGPIDVTVDRAAADRYLHRAAYASEFYRPGGPGHEYVPCGSLGNSYTAMLEDRNFYFLNALQARCEEEYLRPINVGEPLTCIGSIADAGTTRSGLVFVDVSAEVRGADGSPAFRSTNRLVVSPETEATE